VSLGQLKVMAAIEQCRSAALGGHVERCEDCGHSRIADNSCRNRHCPKCQGAAARDWLADRAADLLPVGYFHLVFTLPAEIAPIAYPIAYQNKAVVYDLLFRTAAETLLPIVADPRRLGARVGATVVLHSWGSAMTHHPHLPMIVPGGGISLDGRRWVPCRPGFFLPVRVLSRLFRRLFLAELADACAAGVLRRARRPAPPTGLRRAPRATQKEELVRLRNRPSPGPRRCSPISPAIPTARRHLEQPPARPRRARCDLPLQGLSPQRAGAIPHDDARAGRVHPALPAPRPAQGLPPHPPLRFARQRPCKINIARARELIAMLVPVTDPPVEHDEPDLTASGDADHRPPCPCCGGRMIIVETFEPASAPRAPPSPDVGVRTATP
jgi:hypothetical protein